MKLTGSVLLSWRDSCCICRWVQVIPILMILATVFTAADTLRYILTILAKTLAACYYLLYLIETEELADVNAKYGLEKNLTSSSM